MDIASFAPLVVPVVGGIIVALIQLRPKKDSASSIMQKNFELLSSELSKERESRIAYEAKTNEQISRLSKDVERLWQNTVVLKRHIVELETELCDNDLAIPARPPEVQAIFS